jgi:SAM-dependent methyltransferase
MIAPILDPGCAVDAMKSTVPIRLVAALTVLLVAARATWAQTPDVPFVPTPPVVVNAMLELAGVGPEDYVVDLGSGDGRIVIAAAKKRGARGLGVEIDGALVGEARREARRQGVDSRVEFRMDDLLQTNVGRATVVTMYLYPRLMLAMRPRLIAELKPGARIVSHEFGMQGWEPDTRVTVPVPDKPYGAPSSEVLLWIVPADARGVWRWRSVIDAAPVDYEAVLSQDFQKLGGSAVVGRRVARIEAGTMRGEEIRFFLVTEAAGHVLRHEFRGRVSGDAIKGIVTVAGGGEAAWEATRVRR